MKKIIAGILAVAMVMSFAACGDSSSKSDSSSKASSSSAAESSSAADSSAADSSAAESTADSSAAGTETQDASVAGAWTISGGLKVSDNLEVTLDAIAAEMQTTVDALSGTTVFNDDGTYTAYAQNKTENGTYTVSGNTVTMKDDKGETTNMTVDGEAMLYSIDDNYKLIMKKDPSFTPPTQEQQTEAQQGGEEQPAEEQQGEEQAAE